MVEVGEIMVRIGADNSSLVKGMQEAQSTVGSAGQTMASGMEGASSRMEGASVRSVGSFKQLGLGMTQAMTSAFSLYRSIDDLEKKQYQVEKANLAVDRSEQAVKKAQDDYNAAMDKFGPTSQQATDAAIKLQIATDANDLANERARLSQNSLNDSMLQAGIMIIPSVISGIDGMSKVWKNLKDLDIAGHLGGIKNAISGLGSGSGGILGSAIAGVGALTFAYMAFTSKSSEMKAAFSLLAGAMVAAAAAQWILNIASAFGLSLTIAGIAIVAAAGFTAAAIYALSSSYGATAEPPPDLNNPAGSNPSGGMSPEEQAAAKAKAALEAANAPTPMAQATSTDLYRDKNGNLQTAAYLTAHPEMQGSYYDTSGNQLPWASYLALPDNMRRYAEGGWAMTPQIAMLGEKGPELVVPQSQMSELGGARSVVHNWYIDGSRDVDLVLAEITKRLRQTTGVKF